MDPRQLVAGILTITMFVMLGNMIHREHFREFSPPLLQHPESTTMRYDATKAASENIPETLPKDNEGPWKEDVLDLKPCWTKPVLEETEQSQGFVTFSLTNGPEYHVSQIADAVAVARYLRATLVVPDIRGSKPGDKRNFEEIYDVEKFIKSLDGVVKVVKYQPDNISARNLEVLRVPNRVTEGHIAEQIEPIFRAKGNIRLATYFPSVNMKKTDNDINSVACLAMFGTLELQPEVQEVVDSMVERLRTLSRKSDGQFIAVDLRADILEKKGCQGKDGTGSKRCYSPQEIAIFLRKVGFNKDTAIYLTQSRWDDSLNVLKELFPKTYTKEGIMPADKKPKFLNADASEFEKVIDFYISSRSDVFVPAISGLFYANVAGKRIASGRTQILVPANVASSSASVAEFISHYVSRKNHLAYSCFC